MFPLVSVCVSDRLKDTHTHAEMKLMCALMLLLLKTAACLERNCSLNQSDQICYAALGHKLNLLMVMDMSEYDLKIQKTIKSNQDDPVCKVKNGRMRDCDLFNKRPEVTVIKGTLIINPVIRTDSGDYTVTLYDSIGTETSKADLQVIVEAPIGSVNVSLITPLEEQRRVSCSSDGDQLLYSWTLNGQTLIDGHSSIELNESTDGNLTCRVKNHVSDGQKSVTVKTCPGSTTATVTSSLTSSVTSGNKSSAGMNHNPTQGPGAFHSLIQYCLFILGGFALILILLFITVCYVYRKKQPKSTPEPVPSADVEYAAVNTQAKRKERKEEEVQYGEVTFVPNCGKPKCGSQPSTVECVYSEVNRR